MMGGDGRVILLVEDNKDDADLARLALEEAKVTRPLVHARDGAEALDYVFRRGEFAGRSPETDPKVIFLDLKLPRVDGLDVLKQVRQDPATKRTPVVILTTSKEHEDLVQGYDSGANSYIQKPVDYSKFIEAVKQLSVYWLLLNECPKSARGER